MGINRISIFLHTFASSSGVSVGGVSESNEAWVLFERCSRYVVCNFSSAAIEKGEPKRARGSRRRKGNEVP